MLYHEKEILSFNDTDYPLNLSNKSVNQINTFLNKSFTVEVPWITDSDIKITENGFLNETISLPTTTFLKKESGLLMNMSFNSNSYTIIGPPMVKVVLDLFRSFLPQNPISINEEWTAKIGHDNEKVEFNIKLKSHNEEYTTFEVENEDEKREVVLDNGLGFLGIFDVTSNIRVYSYDSGINNSSISGNYNNDKLNGIATFKIKHPVKADDIKINVSEGKFNFSLDLKESVFGTLTFNKKITDLFITPGMRINLDWQKGNKYPVALGEGANDLNCVFKYLSEIFYFDYSTADYSKQKIIEITNSYKNKAKSILDEFDGLISAECKNFIKTETTFRIAFMYVSAREDIEREKLYNSKNKSFNTKQANENAQYFVNYSDSLELIATVSHCSDMYHLFLTKYLELKQRMFLYERGRRHNRDDYRENILFAGIQYVGYPYYYSVYKLLETEILNGNHLQIEKELEDFATLLCNPLFINSLDKLIQKMELIKVGNPFPFPEIIDIANKTQKLPKGELCIVDLKKSFSSQCPQHKEELEELTRIIKEDNRISKINYVVVRADFAKGKMVETPSNDTVSFKHIYLPEGDITLLEKCQVSNGTRRILLLDKNHRIIDNNLQRIQKYSGHDFPKILNDYFESQNKPTSQAGNSRLLLVIMVSLIGFGLLSWFIIKIRTKQISKREEARRKLSELELRAIRSQMNPHFIFNAMGSIQNLINHNNIKNANLYLSSFARLMRMVLANSNKKLVSLSDELQLLKHYLELEQLRVDFQFDISLTEDIDPETEEIPGMLVQPFVENAVIHGITPKGSGNISVKFSKKSGNLICEIVDDGVGINQSQNGNGNGLAMKLSEERLKLLNSQLDAKLQLKVENRMKTEHTNGTKITLTIPV